MDDVINFAQFMEEEAEGDVAVLISLKGVKAATTAAPPKPYINQDRAFILPIAPRFTAFGVFDGHGVHGHLVADHVANVFKRTIQSHFSSVKLIKKSTGSDILQFIDTLFQHANLELERGDSGIDVMHSGCTGSVAIRHRQMIYVGYVGDSKVATVHFQGKKPYCLMETPEHNPVAPGEAQRIRLAGSRITVMHVPCFTKPVSRIVEAGLSVSRSFGDFAAHEFGVTGKPDLLQFAISDNKDKSSPARYPVLLVLASDGLWDTATYLDVLEHLSNNVQPQHKLLARTKKLAETAWRRRVAAEGRADDTTVIAALIR